MFMFGESCRRAGSAGWIVIASVLMVSSIAEAGPRWKLVYYRQIGNHVNANGRTFESHLFREDGTKGAGVGVTNQSNAGFPIFGTADADGWHRITSDLNNCAYDIRIYDPSAATDQSPTFYYQHPQVNQYYSYVLHWMYVADDALVITHPQTPVYHYDQVAGINQASGFSGNCEPSTFIEPPGVWSDQRDLSAWTEPQFQTFVVPAAINRIVSAQAFAIRNNLEHFQYRATIVQDNGGSITSWPAVGPSATSRCVVSIEFFPVQVNWALHDVPVTPGGTYALKLESVGNPACADNPQSVGFNVYATTSNTYANGQLFHGSTPVPGRDMLALVVGVQFDDTPPAIVRAPASFTRSVARGRDLPDDAFTIANSAGGVLSYTINDNAGWLSVDPSSGTATTETDSIAITYATASLAVGLHTGTITISDPNATNSPQTVVVNLTVRLGADFDGDGDVDLDDYAYLQVCYSGAGIAQPDPNCGNAKLDVDDDVDGDDLDVLAGCLSGSDVPFDAQCAD